jgi:hypothetical protein
MTAPSQKNSYRSLDSFKTVETIRLLNRRIAERFPASGLCSVGAELCQVAVENQEKCEAISRPNLGLRFGVSLVLVLGLAALAYSVAAMKLSLGSINLGEFVQITEAAINDLVFIGVAVFFLVTVETRIKRNQALEALAELRAIDHVIDMHQLTKDPSQFGRRVITTESSPKRDMSAFQLLRYFNYCSEMLSLTGKVAAHHAQSFRDPGVLVAVNELENLTTGLSRKVWQKIMILNKLDRETVD